MITVPAGALCWALANMLKLRMMAVILRILFIILYFISSF
jgi:hypothetical protein